MRKSWVIALIVTHLSVVSEAPAQSVAPAEELATRVTERQLDNGLTILLVEDHSAPVIAFNLMFGVGGIDEPEGLGGIAHMVEHMAFKGTSTVGTSDAAGESAALAEVEVRALALSYLRREGTPEEAAAAQSAFEGARERAQALARPSALDELLSQAGAVGLNASTGFDRTSYVVELPANRLELYARIYADVLRDTVFRYFYAERDVVRQERRQRSEDDPQGFLFEAFQGAAYIRHPYGRSLIGSAEVIDGYRATQARAFFEAFYHPGDAVLVLVGDVDPQRDLPVLESYFGAVPAGAPPRVGAPAEPQQSQERRVTVRYEAQPQLVVGWHKPTYPEREAFVLDLVDALLSNGRTSRLYQRMILEDGLALNVTTSSAYPGIRYPNLFLFYGQPRAPHGPAELEAALYEELDRLKAQPVSETELDKVKNLVRASTVRSLDSNSGLAAALAFHELYGGGWERLMADLEIYQSITAEEIQAVAQRIFTPENRTVAILLPEGAGEAGDQ
ncbi:MAG: pitrilysin family protein [Trueperaceae bacterium]